MRRLILACFAAALVFVLLAAARAEAMHGDIVVDNLVYSGAHYPVESIGPGAQRRLGRLRQSLRRQGLDVAVAMATTESDATPTPDLFSRPQEYANDLGRRMDAFRRRTDPTRRLRPSRLLVVTPYGVGAREVSDDAIAAARTVPVALDASPREVAAAAGLALQRVAAVSGARAPTLFRRAEVDGTRRVPWGSLALIFVLVGAGIVVGLRLRPPAVARA